MTLPLFIYLDSSEPGVKWGREFWGLTADGKAYERVAFCEIDAALVDAAGVGNLDQHKSDLISAMLDIKLPPRSRRALWAAYASGARPKGTFLALCSGNLKSFPTAGSGVSRPDRRSGST